MRAVIVAFGRIVAGWPDGTIGAWVLKEGDIAVYWPVDWGRP